MEKISIALYDALYALRGEYGVSPEEAIDSIREAIYTLNDDYGIDTGNRAFEDEEQEERDLEAEAERRYFDMADPAYQRDLRTPFEDTLEYDSMMYDDRDYGEE